MNILYDFISFSIEFWNWFDADMATYNINDYQNPMNLRPELCFAADYQKRLKA